MKLSETFGNLTVDGCKKYLSYVNSIDNDVTIGEMKSFLTQRMDIAEIDSDAKRVNLLNELTGKCFKIIFSKTHTVLLNIKSVELVDSYGDVDAVLIGEKIVKYNGELRVEIISRENNQRYSNYIFNIEQSEFDKSEFEKIKNTYNSINF